ncbi:MAG TPA: LpqB family beta-propeller domain-containing protein [Longimicrobium sp.]|nr:LpqB family beta-propeller domain-containing protein [Longimicrobium sp.]
MRTTTAAGASADTLSLAERRAAGGRIVFLSERDSAPQVYTIAPTGEGERRPSSGTGATYPAAVSPDGRTVAAVAVREEGNDHGEQMMLLPLDGAAARAVGPASARARSPSWGPDGRWLVFESDRQSFRDLYRVGADGSGLRRLTENREGNFEPAVSPDGGSIAFASSRDGNAEVYVMRADGGGQRRLTAFHRDDWGPRWSPDGRTIAFLSNREGADRIHLVSPDGTGLRKLNADTARAAGQEADIAWSPDGTRIAHTLHVRAGVSAVRIVDVRTGAIREVARVTGASQPAWSPDGRLLAFSAAAAAGDAELWIARADGTAPTRITRAKGADWLPIWSR